MISTGCPELDLVWARFASDILDRPGVLIADTDEDLNWHAFLGHSIDMQGFRAAEFVGVDDLTRRAPQFVPLKRRGLGVPELGGLWEIPSLREHLLGGTKGVPFSVTLDKLRAQGGAIGDSLAEAFAAFPWRKFHWAVRALIQNSAVLAEHRYSFRHWLRHQSADLEVMAFPPSDFQAIVNTPKGDSDP